VIFKQFYLSCLAHASYFIGDEATGTAAVVDPQRDIDQYIAFASEHALKIKHVFLTHLHADFVAGHLELRDRAGATIYLGGAAKAAYAFTPLRDGDILEFGRVRLKALETPGHTPESISIVVYDLNTSDTLPHAVLTGDTLFIGDVGRPDLRAALGWSATELGGMLFDSLHIKLMALPDQSLVYPAHGAGSLCGRKISGAPFTTIGQEKLMNWAVQIKNRDEFVRKMVENLPDRPQYFAHDVEMNLAGAQPLSSLPALRALSEAELSGIAARGAVVIDTRSAPFFGAGHFPGSFNIGLSSNLFATWVGFLVPFGKEIALVVGSAENAKKARLELARIGYDNVLGYIEADTLARTRQLSQLGVEELHFGLRRGEAPQVLDVRTAGEFEAGHIESAVHIPLPSLPRRTGNLGKDSRLAIICGSGYRSSIAASLLQAQGFSRVQNVMGGMGAYLETSIPPWQPSDLVFIGENI